MRLFDHNGMTQRHPIQSGELLFITTNAKYRQPVFADPAAARIAVETLYSIQLYYPFFLYGFVIMPDHGHYLIKQPEGGSISKTIAMYKRAVSFNIGRGPLWQRRYFVRMTNGHAREILEYIHQNPVRAGLCKKPEDYPWSSASGKWDVSEIDWW